MNSQRKNIVQPADWWLAFAEQAKSEGKSLSEWCGECMLANVAKSVSSSLSDRPPANRPRKERA